MHLTDFFEALAAAPRPRGRPLVILAWAQTLDGSVAWPDGSALAISSSDSFRFTHRLRAFCDGILIGIGAALADDPRLTARYVPDRQPRPVVLDTHLRLPPDARLLAHPRTPLICTGPEPDAERLRALQARGAKVVPLPLAASGRIDLVAALRALQERSIRTLMVEGGPTVHSAFLRSGLADWAAITVGPQLLGGLSALHAVTTQHSIPRLQPLHVVTIGPDLLVWGPVDAGSSQK